jgi:1-acyl-sn-glycerol-3-phosphate acyltransferase
MARAFLVAALTLLFILVVGTPFFVYTLLTGNTDRIYNLGVWAVRRVLWLSGVRLDVRGAEKIPRDRAVVFMPNHQSNCDPPAVFVLLPPVLILAKKEFFRVPVLGRAMRRRGFVPVDRGNRERAIQAVEQATRSLQAGHSFLVFPEGTRSPDGRLRSFKKGVFLMAIKAGAPIVPISVSGSRKIMPKGKFMISPGTVRITVHDAIPTAGTTIDDRERIMARARQSILSGLAPDEQPL